MIYFYVPKEDIEKARKLGAKWDSNKKLWYVSEFESYTKFGKWILSGKDEVSILNDHFYLVEANKRCPHCGKYTKVIAFASNNHYAFYDTAAEQTNNLAEDRYECIFEANAMIIIQNEILPLNDGIVRQLNEAFNFDFEILNRRNHRQYFNRCSHCNSKITNLQSDIVPNISVFNLYSLENAKTLRFYKISIPYDLKIHSALKLPELEVLAGIFPNCKSFNRFEGKLLSKLYVDLEIIQNSFNITSELNGSRRDYFTNLAFNIPIKRVICPNCGGELKIRDGKYGCFVGCSNYPRCRTTKSLTQLIYLFFKENGFKIYKWQRKCWKCGEITSVYSYYPLYELGLAYDLFEFFSGMGLSNIPSLDIVMSQIYPTIKKSYSKTIAESYVANHCAHCKAIQGYNYVVTDPHEIHNELEFEYSMDKYFDRHIPFDLVNPSQEEITDSFEWIEENLK